MAGAPSLGDQIEAVTMAAQGILKRDARTDLEAAAGTLRRVAQSASAGGYALAGVTPGWTRVRVLDAVTGEAISSVLEANVAEGWVVVRPSPRHPAERIARPIRIELTDEGFS